MDSRIQDALNDILLKRDHDSVDDFEHLGHDGSPDDRSEQPQQPQQPQQALSQSIDAPRVDDLLHIGDSFQPSADSALSSALHETKPVPATPPPSADFDKCTAMAQSSDPFQQPLNPVDPKLASMAFVETERIYRQQIHDDNHDDNNDDDNDDDNEEKEIGLQQPPTLLPSLAATTIQSDSDFPLSSAKTVDSKIHSTEEHGEDATTALPLTDHGKRHERDVIPPSSINIDQDFVSNIKSSMLPAPEKSPLIDFLGDDGESSRLDRVKNITDDDSWNVVERTDVKGEQSMPSEPPMKPLPPLPKEAQLPEKTHQDGVYGTSSDFLAAEVVKPLPALPQQIADSKHENVKRRETSKGTDQPPISSRLVGKKKQEIEIAPKEIFRDMGLDAWFNPERLNPKVAALIYWRDPKKSGIVFGTILGVLLSLAYFSLISVLAYMSLLVLSGTILFRIYKTVLQAVQKTSDGHPFKDILDLDLTLPAEKVHEVAEVAVAHANAAVSELRRLFLVEDFVDSLKFGVLLWCLTYVGSWFNGMTLIIIGVVALFTLPKVYETNQEQIDQNLALVQAKINEITAKVKAAIPLGKKTEPTKEE